MNTSKQQLIVIKFCAADLMFGWVELAWWWWWWGSGNPNYLFAFLVWLILGCIPKVSVLLPSLGQAKQQTWNTSRGCP